MIDDYDLIDWHEDPRPPRKTLAFLAILLVAAVIAGAVAGGRV